MADEEEFRAGFVEGWIAMAGHEAEIPATPVPLPRLGRHTAFQRGLMAGIARGSDGSLAWLDGAHPEKIDASSGARLAPWHAPASLFRDGKPAAVNTLLEAVLGYGALSAKDRKTAKIVIQDGADNGPISEETIEIYIAQMLQGFHPDPVGNADEPGAPDAIA